MIATTLTALALATQEPGLARAEGDRLLTSAGAGDLFQNISDTHLIRLQHRNSGMVCIFDLAGARNNVRLYPVRPDVSRRGDDVGCGTTTDAAYTLYATRYEPTVSADDAMAQAINEVRSIWSEVERVELALPPSTPGEFAAFRGRHPNGQMLSTVILVRKVDGWIFKMRASGAPDQLESVAKGAGEQFAAQLPSVPDTGP